MPKAPSSTTRRLRAADRLFKGAPIAMRPCNACSSLGLACRITRQQLECEGCFRGNRKCDLAPDYQGMDKAVKEAEKLEDEILETRLKLARLEKQRKYWRRRLRDLGDQESRNILEVEEDEKAEVALEPSEVSLDPSMFASLSPDSIDALLRDFSGSGPGETSSAAVGS